MRIIICGAGEIGSHASEVLDGNGHSITVIDCDAQKLSSIEDRLDASTLLGSAAHADVLVEVPVPVRPRAHAACPPRWM